MRKLLLIAPCLFIVTAWAQDPPPVAAPSAAQAPAPAPAATPAVPPATPSETLTGWVDFGYRWVPELSGSQNTYRGIVNLGEGPKLFGADLSYHPDKNPFFDRLDIQANSWGGEPNNSARVDAHKFGVYDFNFNYRRMDYFNDLPSFANPLAALGSIASQSARDTERRLFDMQLDLFPKSKFSPFIAFSRDAGDGPGLQNFVFSALQPTDEFSSNAIFNDAQNVVRGGAQLNTAHLHATLEAGGIWFRDNEQVSYNGGANPGNQRTSLLGVNQFLTQDAQIYNSSGSSFFSQGSVLWRPFSSLDVSGQFTFSQPSVSIGYSELATGQFVRLDQLLAYTGESATASGSALRPHPSGNLSLDWRLTSRLRILQSYYTDRFHVASDALFLQTLTGVTDPFNAGAAHANLLLSNPDFQMEASQYNRYQGEVIFDLLPRLTLRAGYRDEWANALISAPTLNLTGTNLESGTERHKTVLSALEFRAFKTLSLHAEGEATVGESTDYFRVGLPDLNKFKMRVRYKPRTWLNLNLTHTWLEGANGTAGINSDFHVRQSSANLMFAPREGKRISLSLDYMNSWTDSTITAFTEPALFLTGPSIYEMNSHTVGAWCDLALFHGARLNVGGSMLLSYGTRPTNFYQPRARFSVPLNARAAWTAEWRYYGFREDLYPTENFNAQLFEVGLRLKLR